MGIERVSEEEARYPLLTKKRVPGGGLD